MRIKLCLLFDLRERDTQILEMLFVNTVFVLGCPHNAFSDHLDSNIPVMHLRLAARSWETGCAKLSYREVRLCQVKYFSLYSIQSKTWVPHMNTESVLSINNIEISLTTAR